jgi:hypothetical protein
VSIAADRRCVTNMGLRREWTSSGCMVAGAVWAEDVSRAVQTEFAEAQRRARGIVPRASDERAPVEGGIALSVVVDHARRRIVKVNREMK